MADATSHPDRYPPPPHQLRSHPLPALSSAASSAASTRSSASALAYSDFANPHVVSPDDHDPPVGLGFPTDAVAHMLASDPSHSSSSRSLANRTYDPSRWSESYPAGPRSRSSSLTNGVAPYSHKDLHSPPLSQKPSYDVSWQTVDERDEIPASEEETDDEHGLDSVEDDLHDPDDLDERTSAAVVAEEGRGLIIQGENVPIQQLHDRVQPGTTHLLIGSSPTPNYVPTFLTSVLPQIAHTLLALDISANFLGALPPVLAVCESLEELNVASNPLRVLPVFLADLTNLRVLIADSTGITTLPDALVDLDKLHTISIRRNKLNALPSWLCLLPALQTLCVDGNPFQGPWKALVDPLLAKVPATPVYPPSTPMLPLLSAGVQSNNADTETDGTDTDDFSDHDLTSPGPVAHVPEEDHTITPDRAVLGRATTSPYNFSNQSPGPSAKPLVRTRTTPNRAYFDQSRNIAVGAPIGPRPRQSPNPKGDDSPFPIDQPEIRKMKSAGDLRRTRAANANSTEDEMPQRPAISHYPTSLSSSNLLNTNGLLADPNADQMYPKRFASLGPSSIGTQSRVTGSQRAQLSQSMWEGSSVPPTLTEDVQMPSRPGVHAMRIEPVKTEDGRARRPPTREKSEKEKSRWGFLKKMSMGKMKDSPAPSPSLNPPRIRSQTSSSGSPPQVRPGFDPTKSPQIDLRFSTTGALDALPVISAPAPASMPPSPNPSTRSEKPFHPPSAAVSNGLLAAPIPTPRAAKRRSFLPIDAPGAMSLSIPDTSRFVTGVVVSHEGEDPSSPDPARGTTPSPVLDHEQYIRREEDRARDAYMRALRSVMAYLKDMNDLTSTQSNSLSMYGSSATTTDDQPSVRSRRPTIVDGQREGSMISSGSESQLRSSDSLSGNRSGTSSQTLSVVTTDSTGSQEERKWKDDKGKRINTIREIVTSERKYVQGLQDLVDIYVKPASVPVNLLSGVGSSKDSIVPAAERKVVFGGVESVTSFHKDILLPALERAAAPLMKSTTDPSSLDPDGQLSMSVGKAVGNAFVKHVAFMKMYSSYINNFDSSVQRVKYWTTDKAATPSQNSGNALSPSSSSAHLVGLGMSMAASGAPGAVSDKHAASGVPNLSTSQRKRIKGYLKRCRLNPKHTQINLEGYLLLPVQRIPRYKLLLESLLKSTPPPLYKYEDDPLERALTEVSLIANTMNEGKRESESQLKLVRWQTRIRGKFPSPLVQPHRRLIMDGPLMLTRVVRKAVVSFEAINAQGDASNVQVDCLAPELTPRPLIGILCNDLLVLCRDPSEGQDPNSPVDLWAVLRMQTLPQPASIVHGNALRLVDNKAILYFDAPSPSDALNWYRAINLHIPASKA